MIRKLRIKFIAINMSIVSIMLCIILGLVFSSTRANLKTESIAMMQSLAAQHFRPRAPAQQQEEVRLPYFVLQLGPHDTLLSSDGGFYDLSDDQFLMQLVNDTVKQPQNMGVIREYRLRYYRIETPMGQRLVFADISSEIATLHNLIRSCVAIGILSFFAFLFASILLSKWAVRPVDQAWQQQRKFVADASHELKTPLAVILTNAELLSSPEFDSESKHTFSENILTMSLQMKGLVEQLLSLARADAAQGQPPLVPVAFSSLVEKAVLPFEAVFFEQGLELEVSPLPEIALMGDEGQLRQVVEILLDNARKYSSPGGKTWVELHRQGKTCRLTVKNQGPPISEQDLRNIFKRFYRVDQARSRDGSFGLGLSIAEGIVTRHRGKIWAQSEGELNSLHVELPCQL